jgi:glyceraldehyde 3-phosphate dehydrogenase
MRVAINGMGRIGRLLFRRLMNEPSIELVAVNDIMDKENLLYLLKYDSVYGSFPEQITMSDNHFVAANRSIRVFSFSHPMEISWGLNGVDLIIDCTGQFTQKKMAEAHLRKGAKKVLLSATGSPDIPTLIYGYNHHRLTKDMQIISPGGCMINCATHILYLLNSIGIEAAQINVLHSYTSRQHLTDTSHNEWRRGRAAAESIIPVETDLGASLENLLHIKHITAMSTRIPVSNGAMADFTVQLKKKMAKEQVNQLFQKAAAGTRQRIIGYTDDPLVSPDIRGYTNSAIIDGTLTSVAGSLLKVVAWFDNESGYVSRLVDWIHLIKSLES